MEIIVEDLGNVPELANIYVEIQPANVRVPYVKSMIVMNYVSLMWLGTAANWIILHMFVTVVPKRNFVPTRDLCIVPNMLKLIMNVAYQNHGKASGFPMKT